MQQGDFSQPLVASDALGIPAEADDAASAVEPAFGSDDTHEPVDSEIGPTMFADDSFSSAPVPEGLTFGEILDEVNQLEDDIDKLEFEFDESKDTQ